MVARTIRVARHPFVDDHGSRISPDLHRRDAQSPPLSVTSRNPVTWLRVVVAELEATQMRADGRRGVQVVAEYLAVIARSDATVMPTWARLVDGTGLSRATVARHLRCLRLLGLLVVLETGSTPATRGRWNRFVEDGNRAALYQLHTPTNSTPAAVSARVLPLQTPSKISETPGLELKRSSSFLRRGARKKHCPTGDFPAWSVTATTHTRTDRLAAADALQAASMDLRPLSTKHVQSKIRPWLRAGWTVADLLWAIDHTPDGRSRTWTGFAANPAPWLATRLAPWIDHLAPSVVAAETQKRLRQGQATQRLAAGLPAVTQADRDQVHTEARRAAQEALEPQTIDPATARAGAAACRAALAAVQAQRAA